jgi:hypothetical protein
MKEVVMIVMTTQKSRRGNDRINYGFLERLIKSKFVFSGDLLIHSK